MRKEAYSLKEWDDKFKMLTQKMHTITDEIEQYLLDYFKSSFITKEWDDQKWKQSKNNHNTLIESKDLMKSIKTKSKTAEEIHIQSATPYSAIHQYGGKIKITEKMRKFFWSQYYKTKKDMWKGMALTKKSYIVIPQRQFMGYTREMENEITKILQTIIT